jgi:hypothetical protein
MQDQYAGQAGTFYTDPDTGERITQEEWEGKQVKAAGNPAKVDIKPTENQE